MATRQAITKVQATRYRSGSRAVKTEILDTVCAVTGFNRDYARRALQRQTLAAPRRSPPGRGLGFCGEPGQTGWVSFRPRT